jgi:hypothetical protein
MNWQFAGKQQFVPLIHFVLLLPANRSRARDKHVKTVAGYRSTVMWKGHMSLNEVSCSPGRQEWMFSAPTLNFDRNLLPIFESSVLPRFRMILW